MPDNIATQIADALQTHNIDLLRIDAADRREILAVLAALGPDVVKRIERVDPTGVTRIAARRNRLRILLDQVWEIIKRVYAQVIGVSNTELQDVARFETRSVTGIVNSTVGVELVSGRLTEPFLRSIVSNALIEGAPSASWWREQRDDFRKAFEREMRIGVLQGESIQELTRRVRGTRARRFQDGLMATTTRRAEALVRSSVLSVANEARFRMYQDNEDTIKGVQWLSTLDSRTTDICKALDGQAWFLNGRRMPGTELKWRGPPPAHWNCRSTLVPVLKSWSELARDPETREKLRRAEAANPRENLRASMDGAVSGDLNYETWLRSKPVEFQKEVLGPRKHALWVKGKLPFTQLVDQGHNPKTVAELEAEAK